MDPAIGLLSIDLASASFARASYRVTGLVAGSELGRVSLGLLSSGGDGAVGRGGKAVAVLGSAASRVMVSTTHVVASANVSQPFLARL